MSSSLPSPSPDANQNQSQAETDPQDCLACKIIGTAALGSVGLYALNQSRRGQPGTPMARRVMALVGVGFLGMSYVRWNMNASKVGAATARIVNQTSS